MRQREGDDIVNKDTRDECAQLIGTQVTPLLESGSLPPMWPFWLPLVDAIAERIIDSRVGHLERGLVWIQEFAAKMTDTHTGFVHVERRARTALAERTMTK